MVSFLRQGSGVHAVRRGASRWLTVMGLAASAVAVTVPSSGAQARLQPAVVDTSSLARGTRQLTNFVGDGAGSNAQNMTALGSKTVFYADDGVHGVELWVTDGTTSGTTLLKDIAPGASSSKPAYSDQIVVMGNKAYFAASSGELDHALWSTDGTTAGTQLVHQFTVDHDDCPPNNFAVLNSRLYFSADDVNTGCELWTSDGTDAGTRLVKDVIDGGSGAYPEGLITVGSKIVYRGMDANYDNELWVTDGTTGGTVRLFEINTNPNGASYPQDFVSFASGTKAAFIARGPNGSEVWVTDGTVGGTLRDSPSGFEPNLLVAAGSAISYSGTQECSDSSGGSCNFLLSSNGSGGIVNVEDSLENEIYDMVSTGSVVYFVQSISNVTSLYRLNGGVRSSVLTSRPNLFQFPGAMFTANGKLYFGASSDEGYELWVSDGTDATTGLVKDFEPGAGSSDFLDIGTVGNRTLISAGNFQFGNELWVSDGSPTSTSLVKDINAGTTGALPRDIAALGNKALYAADGDSAGDELWSTDVVTGVTTLVSDINLNGDSYPSDLTVLGNKVVFAATDEVVGNELFVTDGSPAGTQLLRDINSSDESYLGNFVTMNGKAYFTANNGSGIALWVTDGTQNGTQIVSSGMDDIREVAATSNKIFFVGDDGTNGLELWVTDGNATPTMLSLSSGVDSYSPSKLTATTNAVFFTANNGTARTEIWKSDGTLGGTVMIRDINAVSDGEGGTDGSYPHGLTALGSQVIFAASDGTGIEPWITDGTSGGTRKIKDINSYTDSIGEIPWYFANQTIFAATASGTRAYFVARGDETGFEIWVTDGSEAGTYVVRDAQSGPESSDILYVTTIGEQAFFALNDFSVSSQYSSQFGSELWTSDGTEAGTYMVRNIAPDSASSYPGQMTAFGDRLLFVADAYNGRGQQLFITDGSRSTFSNLAQPVRILDTRSGNKVGALDGSGAAYTLQVTGTSGVPYHGVAAVSLNVTAVSTEAGNEGGYVTVYPCGTRPDASNLNFTSNQTVPNAVVAPVSSAGTVCFYVYGKAHLLADVSGWLPSGGFTSLAKPERLLNTRSAGAAGKIGALNGSGAAYTLQVTGVNGIPASGVGAVAMNVTAVDAEAGNEGGYVTVYPCGTRPDASNLNFTSGQTVPNAVVAPVSSDGKVCFYVYGKAHLLADVSGWMPTGGFTALTKPERLANTRTIGAAGKVGVLDGSGASYTLQVAGVNGIPASGVGAVAMNVTVVDGVTNDFGGYVTVYPCGTKPDASNLNFTSGQTVPNAVIAPVSADGKVCIYVYGQAHILADVSGYLAS